MVFPYHKQETKYTCGAAAMRMALGAAGVVMDEKRIAKILGTNKVRGTWLKNFPVLAEELKMNYVIKRNSSIHDIKRLLRLGYTVVVVYWYPSEKIDHYSVIRNIDTKFVHFYDPWFGPNHKYTIPYFLKNWKSDVRWELEYHWLCAIKK